MGNSVQEAQRRPGRPYTGGRQPIRSIRVPDDEWSQWKARAAEWHIPVARLVRIAVDAVMKRKNPPKEISQSNGET